MRSERVIREYLEALKKCHAEPCDCADRGGLDHSKCVLGGKFMEAEMQTLQWVLGDNDDIGNRVERMVKAAGSL